MLLGIGGGWNAEEMEHQGTPFARRWRVLRERVLSMKEIWTRGDGPTTFERVLEYCDGWMPIAARLIFGLPSDTRERVLPRLDARARVIR